MSGDRSPFNQKGPPLRCAQWETKRTGRWSGPRENAPGGLKMSAPPEGSIVPLDPHNRGASAEAQCGTAPRAARDLTGEPCSPVSPFFLDRGLWLGVGASRKTLWGGGAHFSFRRAKVLLGPGDFSLVPPGGTISFSKKEMVGPTVPRLEGGSPRPAPVARIPRPRPRAEPFSHGQRRFPSAGNPRVQAVLGSQSPWRPSRQPPLHKGAFTGRFISRSSAYISSRCRRGRGRCGPSPLRPAQRGPLLIS